MDAEPYKCPDCGSLDVTFGALVKWNPITKEYGLEMLAAADGYCNSCKSKCNPLEDVKVASVTKTVSPVTID